MNRVGVAAACAALALLTFFQFPGHTWLQQDSQIFVPILENQRDAAVLRNDPVVQHPHTAFTLYDEVTQAIRLPGFRVALEFQQIVTRALGIWGLYLMATAAGLTVVPALTVAAICSLGASIVGPFVLTIEYEPTPRAFALPLLLCAIGLAAHRRYLAAGVAGAAAFLYHPPTTLPFWAVLPFAIGERRLRSLAPLAVAAAILLATARGQGDAPAFFTGLTPSEEQLQRMRASYVWISTWAPSTVVHYLILAAVLAAAFVRVRPQLSRELRWFLIGMPALGLLSIPLSWLLLERAKWALIPQVQPLRALLFVTLFAIFLCALAAMRARRWESIAWLSCAYLLPLQPLVTGPYRMAAILAVGLAALTTVARPLALAAFFVIPWLGGVVNYPRLHTPELAQLSEWARASTPLDAVFVFPDAGRTLYPGIFRSEALRAVYVDWKSGGQVNYIRGFGEQWRFRWQQSMTAPVNPPKYEALGITYMVVQPEHKLGQAAEFENSRYLVYRVAPERRP
jgi:hypothetical protein